METPTAIAEHHCPADGCDAMIPDTMLACRSDWFRVTETTQRQVADAYGDPNPNVVKLAVAKAVAEMNVSRRKVRK